MSITEEKIKELQNKIELLKYWIKHSYESQEKEQKAINVADKLLIDIKSTLKQVVKETKEDMIKKIFNKVNEAGNTQDTWILNYLKSLVESI